MVSELAEAKLAARGAPIIGILPIADPRLERRALLEGARECCSLDAPLQNLKAAFQRAARAHEKAKRWGPLSTRLLSKKSLWDFVVYAAALAAGMLVAWGLVMAAAVG